MKVEKQVCRLGLAKRIEELGIKQDSLFYWASTATHAISRTERVVDETKHIEVMSKQKARGYNFDLLYSAFTVAELGELLQNFNMRSVKTHSSWVCSCDNEAFYANTEANARAKNLIYLLENNLIEKEEK